MHSYLLGRLFSRKRFLLYSNLKSAAYFKIASTLQSAGISFRTVNKYETAEPQCIRRDIYIHEEDRGVLLSYKG